MDKNLNELLRWSIEAQAAGSADSTTNGSAVRKSPATAIAATGGDTSQDADAAQRNSSAPAPTAATKSALTPEVLAALLGGPSEADLMRQSVAVIAAADDPEVTLEHRLTAFDNLEMLIQSLDNANNLGPLGLWSPILAALADAEPEVRRCAAWVVGTAVQNNGQCQERLLAMGGLPVLVGMALARDEREDVRRKAVYALSSATRNYQPAMDVVAVALEEGGHRKAGSGTVDAANMDAVDEVMDGLKERVKSESAETAA